MGLEYRNAKNKKAQRGGWAFRQTKWQWLPLPSGWTGQRSTRTRGHAGRHAGGGQDVGVGGREQHGWEFGMACGAVQYGVGRSWVRRELGWVSRTPFRLPAPS